VRRFISRGQPAGAIDHGKMLNPTAQRITVDDAPQNTSARTAARQSPQTSEQRIALGFEELELTGDAHQASINEICNTPPDRSGAEGHDDKLVIERKTRAAA
jgi:hypothetical protein